ncbi:MAG: transposase [Herminiimonas sp.]|nr:transposase [Herminiimonas sp.]
MKVRTCGIDLAKSVFAIHAVDVHGRACLCRQLRRQDMAAFFARMEPCLVGIEACASAHYLARKLTELGHSVS